MSNSLPARTNLFIMPAPPARFFCGTRLQRYLLMAHTKRPFKFSGGAVNSPQIMLLSGVGPSEQLRQHSIPVVHDLPGVGQHLTDHIAININFRTLPGYSLMRYLRPTGLDILTMLKEVLRYKLFGTGLLTLHSQESMAFVKTTDPSLFPPSQHGGDYEDSSSGAGAPDLEVMAASLAWRVSDTCFM